MSKVALVSGSSGLVGMQLLHQLFQNAAYDWVISFGRRDLALKHPKLVQIKVDFKEMDRVNVIEAIRIQNSGGDFQPLIRSLETASAQLSAYCALGTTIKAAGSKEKFYQIDHDFVIGFARMVLRIGASRFFYVSALGADAGSSIYYSKVKGEVENDLKRMDFTYVGIFQPSLLLGERNENRIGEEVGKILMKGLTFLGILKKYKPIYGHQVAQAMVVKDGEADITGNETITSSEMHGMVV
ncbi:Rossmann-fold NAD(P)-binding domain-containing protein [Cyclobacterium salsum]|uniref:oxidoreductase n=1 Tax=Cyclobacterium salsum TaxID=2666329 RepID=UPI001391C075|nr:oxidoreductase [Cyclobacterium salsum]